MSELNERIIKRADLKSDYNRVHPIYCPYCGIDDTYVVVKENEKGIFESVQACCKRCGARAPEYKDSRTTVITGSMFTSDQRRVEIANKERVSNALSYWMVRKVFPR